MTQAQLIEYYLKNKGSEHILTSGSLKVEGKKLIQKFGRYEALLYKFEDDGVLLENSNNYARYGAHNKIKNSMKKHDIKTTLAKGCKREKAYSQKGYALESEIGDIASAYSMIEYYEKHIVDYKKKVRVKAEKLNDLFDQYTLEEKELFNSPRPIEMLSKNETAIKLILEDETIPEEHKSKLKIEFVKAKLISSK